jgi:rhamnulokinase
VSRDRGATVAAVDLGASSGRVIVGRFGPDGASLREVHRFPNEPVRAGGVLRWDVLALFRGILDGLRRAEEAAGPLDAIGVDAWGVDYGLIDGDGQLIGNPAHYRDPRTGPAVDAVLADPGAAALYAATGTQFQPFNTVFQLLADRGSARLAAAAQALLIPDLMTYWLSGVPVTELTNASTTGLLDPRTLDWTGGLARQLGVPIELFPPIRRPGEVVGPMLADVAADAGLIGRPLVVTVPSHDTAAAVAGLPVTSDRAAYVSTGTWALVGVELPHPVITEGARAANFTNEIGATGDVRFLRNVTGFWLLQECVREWRAGGLDVDAAGLSAAAAGVPPLHALIDVQEPGFAAPGGMPARIAEASERTSGAAPSNPAEITRCILDSMAVAIRRAVRDAVRLSGHAVEVVHVVGGGVFNPLFCQSVADACELPVLAGPVEAAAWGNAVWQAHALNALGEPPAAVIRRAEPPVVHAPLGDELAWQRADDMLNATDSAHR